MSFANAFGVASRVAQGPRPEVQDLPFALRLTRHAGRLVKFDPTIHRLSADGAGDLLVAGILDGMGGTALAVDDAALRAETPFFHDRGLVSARFRRIATPHLTGLAAAHFLLAAIERHAPRLGSGPDGSYTLRELLGDASGDLIDFQHRLAARGIARSEFPIGAAVTISASWGDGRAQYANCGDCRAGIVQSLGGGHAVRELSRKQTMATANNTELLATTTGQVEDNRIMNALGVAPVPCPEPVSTFDLAPGDLIVHLTDGAKEAMMHDPRLADLAWDARDLKAVFERVVVPALTPTGRVFPIVHRLFTESVLPFVADPSTSRGEAKVFDNVSLLGILRSDLAAAAADQLYGQIHNGMVKLSRDPYAIECADLRTVAAEVGLVTADGLERLERLLEMSGLEVVGGDSADGVDDAVEVSTTLRAIAGGVGDRGDAVTADALAARILLIEDDEIFALMASAKLRQAGFKVARAKDGVDGLAMARATPPDLIILDILMPKMDGWEVILRLRAEPAFATVPVIFLTGLEKREDRMRGFRLGADDYITKRTLLDELEVRVTAALERRTRIEGQVQRSVGGSDGAAATTAGTVTLSARLAEIGVPSVLTILEKEKKTGQLLVTDDGSGESARFFIKAGRVISIRLEQEHKAKNVAALTVVLSWGSGLSAFSSATVDVPVELAVTTSELLLQAATLEDETRRAELDILDVGFS